MVIGWAAGAGLVLTLIAALAPSAAHTSHSLTGHVTIETSATVVGALVAYLLVGRAQRTGERTDVLLAVSLCVLALSNLMFSLVPAVLNTAPDSFTTWTPFGGRLIAALGIAAAALTPHRRLTRPRVSLMQLAFVAVLALLAIALFILIAGDHLPRISAQDSGSDIGVLSVPPAFAALQVTVTLLYLAAAAGLLWRVERAPEPFLAWLGAAIAFLAFANLNYFLFPALRSDHIYTGDFFRLAAYIALLAGAFREIDTYQHKMAELAIFDERRRLASDLHAGLAQELALINAHSKRLASQVDAQPDMVRLVSAAERALDESRSAIQALTRPADEPLEQTLRSIGQTAGERAGVATEFDIAPGIAVTPQVREVLLRVLREAIANAARHGHARLVRIQLTAGSGVRLVISDEGAGFDPKAPRRPDAMGLVVMEERVQNMRGRFSLMSAPGIGTLIEVELP